MGVDFFLNPPAEDDPDDHADDPTAAWTAEEQVAMQTGDPLVEKD